MYVVNLILFQAETKFGMRKRLIFSSYLEVSVMEVVNSNTGELSIEVPCLWSLYCVEIVAKGCRSGWRAIARTVLHCASVPR